MNKKGFTLVELLAVIAILAILVIMALPAVLRMFNSARKDSFTNEVNTIIRTARQQYLLSGGQDTTWSNASGSTKSLDLTGNSRLIYYVKMNNEGKITKLQVSNGDFQYNVTNNAGIDVVESSSVEEVTEENELIITMPSVITYVVRQNEGQITRRDEISIAGEPFYVVSSNENETVLVAQYNLYVGNVYNSSNYTYTYVRTIDTSEEGYGLQNPIAKGRKDAGTNYQSIGAVPFSGKGYWDNANCVWSGSGNTKTCSGTAGLRSEYANASNAAGATSLYTSPYPYIYNNMFNAPSNIIHGESGTSSGAGHAQDNGYTIAYYVEGYVNRLKSLGAPNNITGRLLTREEASTGNYSDFTNGSYWLGSARNSTDVWAVRSNSFISNYPFLVSDNGVRPVIIISTSSIPN